MRTRVEIVDETGIGCSEAVVIEVVRAVLENEEVEGAVAIVCVDEDSMTELNGRYRGVYEPTDVLSFAYAGDSDWPELPSSQMPREHAQADEGDDALPDLGEVIICPAVVRRYAEEDGREAGLQLGWSVVHGVLHLLGYDHDRDHGEMRRREQELLEELGPTMSAPSSSGDA